MTQFNALKSVSELRSLLAQQRSGFSCEPIPMRDATAWRQSHGAISHASGGFFSVVAVAGKGASAAPPRVLLYQPQSAFNGLLITTVESELHLLLQARVEPGNIGVAQYGPTVQSTPANYLRLHGGRATPYLDYFHSCVASTAPVGDWTELDLGSRYLYKNKRLVCMEAEHQLASAPGFHWVPARVLKKAVLEGALLNTDLRSLLAVMPWTRWPVDEGGADLTVAAHVSLHRAPRPAVLGQIVARVGQPPPPVTMVAVESLEHWELNEYGLFEREPGEQGFDVQFYRVEAPTREVPRWTQPLLNSHTRGAVDLALTVSDGALMALVHVHAEPGLSTGAAVFPSRVVLPGQKAAADDSPVKRVCHGSGSTVLAATLESDEGGRFYQDESRFALYFLDEAVDVGEDFMWLTLSELKCLLSLSNTCSLQLRCIASMVLALL